MEYYRKAFYLQSATKDLDEKARIRTQGEIRVQP